MKNHCYSSLAGLIVFLVSGTAGAPMGSAPHSPPCSGLTSMVWTESEDLNNRSPTASETSFSQVPMCPCGCGETLARCNMPQCKGISAVVWYRDGPNAPWHEYGTYRQLQDAEAAANQLRSQGYEVFIQRIKRTR